MDMSDEKHEHERWINILKSEGAVPHFEPDNCHNGWASPPGHSFMVRGPHYFSTKIKIPGTEYLLKPLAFDWVISSTKISDILSHPNSRVKKALDGLFPNVEKPFVWAFNLQVPSKDNYSAVAYFVSVEPVLEGSLVDKFLKGDDLYKKSRLKMIANIVNGPWIVKKAVGQQAICLIGKALSCNYFSTHNFVEVDIDIGSSIVASAIVHLAFGYITKLTVDLAFLIESQTETELPEQILGAVRFSELNLSSARSIDLSSEENAVNLLESSMFSKRLWRSFSNILHKDSHEDVMSWCFLKCPKEENRVVNAENVMLASLAAIDRHMLGVHIDHKLQEPSWFPILHR